MKWHVGTTLLLSILTLCFVGYTYNSARVLITRWDNQELVRLIEQKKIKDDRESFSNLGLRVRQPL